MGRIGQVAAELGLNPKTIRYYEQIGLLPKPRRTPSGYRLYDETSRDHLRFIRKAKEIGLTLREIGEVVALRQKGETPCTHVLDLLDQKLAAVDAHIRRLRGFRRELQTLRLETARTDRGAACVCPIIEQHG